MSLVTSTTIVYRWCNWNIRIIRVSMVFRVWNFLDTNIFIYFFVNRLISGFGLVSLFLIFIFICFVPVGNAIFHTHVRYRIISNRFSRYDKKKKNLIILSLEWFYSWLEYVPIQSNHRTTHYWDLKFSLCFPFPKHSICRA